MFVLAQGGELRTIIPSRGVSKKLPRIGRAIGNIMLLPSKVLVRDRSKKVSHVRI